MRQLLYENGMKWDRSKDNRERREGERCIVMLGEINDTNTVSSLRYTVPLTMRRDLGSNLCLVDRKGRERGVCYFYS